MRITIEDLGALTLEPRVATSTGEPLGRVADLAAALSHLRVHYEVLEPGRRSSRAHHHTTREECVYVIRGRVELVAGSVTHALPEGTLTSIPPGPPFHAVWNRSDAPAALLVFSAAPTPDEVVYE